MSMEQGLQILKETVELRTVQNAEDSPDDLAAIPRLRIADLNKTAYEIPLKVDHDLFDSGIIVLEH